MIVDNIFARINRLKWFPILFVSPNIYSVGDSGEFIYFALLKARKEKKRVIFLYPYQLPFWLVKYKLTNGELFRVDSEFVYFKKDTILFHALRLVITIIYVPLRIVSLCLRKFFGLWLNDSYNFTRIGQKELAQPNEKVSCFSWDAVRSQNWASQFKEKLPVSLRQKSLERGERQIREMGILEDDWFVCVHVRESGFRNDAGRREYRNAKIENYIKAIERIVERGGWVIRMGDETMTKLPKLERVIDYPFTRYKSDMMDIFLIKECRFYVGCQSGILDVASLFQKPTLIVNMYNWTFNYPWFEHSRGILKHIYSFPKKRNLTVKEMFEGAWELQDMYRTVSDDYEIIENTPEEIEEAVLEYMDLLDTQNFSASYLQNKANELRIQTTYQIFEDTRFTDASDEYEYWQRHRIAARIADSKGVICQKYLAKNWN